MNVAVFDAPHALILGFLRVYTDRRRTIYYVVPIVEVRRGPFHTWCSR